MTPALTDEQRTAYVALACIIANLKASLTTLTPSTAPNCPTERHGAAAWAYVMLDPTSTSVEYRIGDAYNGEPLYRADIAVQLDYVLAAEESVRLDVLHDMVDARLRELAVYRRALRVNAEFHLRSLHEALPVTSRPEVGATNSDNQVRWAHVVRVLCEMLPAELRTFFIDAALDGPRGTGKVKKLDALTALGVTVTRQRVILRLGHARQFTPVALCASTPISSTTEEG